MRRIDVLSYTLGLLVLGPVLYFVLLGFKVPAAAAGIAVQSLFILGMLGWVATYVFRVAGRKMTYNQQMADYKQAVLTKRLEEHLAKNTPPEDQP